MEYTNSETTNMNNFSDGIEIRKKIIIDWIRHAESCANLDSNNYHNKNIYPNRAIGYDLITPSDTNVIEPTTKKFGDKLRIFTTKIKAVAKYHPNLSFIGTQQAVLLGSTLVNNHITYDAVFVSPTIRAIMTAMMVFRGFPIIIYVVPYISEGLNLAKNHDNQNTALKSDLLKRQVLFIKDWLENNWISNFDDIYVMNILVDLHKSMSELIHNEAANEIIKIIDEIIQCRPSLQKSGVPIDSYGDVCDTIGKIKNILSILQQNFININDNNEFIDPNIENIYLSLNQILDPKFLRGPPINFDIIQYFEKKEEQIILNDHNYYIHQNLRKPDLSKFYSIILPTIFKMNILDDKNKFIHIACVSHGGAMKKYFSNKYSSKSAPRELLNTQIFREILNSENNILEPYSIDYTYYVPVKIRTMYANFERLNIDICRLESLKGIINYPIYNQTWNSKIKPIISSKESAATNYALSDVKFYFHNTEKYHNITDRQLHGGKNSYQYKYHKYKTKYYQLLNQE
ncbi:histidine phosphatase family [Acanthamoeba polyphaga mimivirus]|uniref:Histidine phosphatase family n=2 Tax=Megamimivirinae TaxID=3044648 RepID=A0A2L2DK25_MIMIV|nr:histidine phosphatase family [Acanthamoeba polyphaga mimivirus]